MEGFHVSLRAISVYFCQHKTPTSDTRLTKGTFVSHKRNLRNFCEAQKEPSELLPSHAVGRRGSGAVTLGYTQRPPTASLTSANESPLLKTVTEGKPAEFVVSVPQVQDNSIHEGAPNAGIFGH